MDLLELLNLVNKSLGEGKSLTAIAKELGKSESTVRKKLNKNGYKRQGNKFILSDNITSNIICKKNKIMSESLSITSNITHTKDDNSTTQLENLNVLNSIDIDKLNLLLNNLDNILKLIPTPDTTGNITNLRSGINNVISLRADTGLYESIKQRAKRDNINISDIVNKSLEDYLKNYI